MTDTLPSQTPVEIRKISQSELAQFRACRRRWYLQHVRRFKKKHKFGPLALGTNIHEALAWYYSSTGGTAEEALAKFDAIYWSAKTEANEYEIADVMKDEELGRIMLEGYFQFIEETGIDAGMEVIEPESEIEYLIDVEGTQIRLVGKRDLIALNALTGTAQLVDHKSCQSFDNLGLELLEQPKMYLLLQRLVGSTEVQEVLWNLLRKVKRTAKAKPPFYKREELYVSEEELRWYYVRVRGIIRDILRVEEQLAQGEDHHEVCYPRPSRDCEWSCEFRKVCPLMDSDPVAAELMLSDMFEFEDPYERYKEVKGI